jgi:hypothetical protein
MIATVIESPLALRERGGGEGKDAKEGGTDWRIPAGWSVPHDAYDDAMWSASRLASVNPVSTGLTEPTVGNKD